MLDADADDNNSLDDILDGVPDADDDDDAFVDADSVTDSVTDSDSDSMVAVVRYLYWWVITKDKAIADIILLLKINSLRGKRVPQPTKKGVLREKNHISINF